MRRTKKSQNKHLRNFLREVRPHRKKVNPIVKNSLKNRSVLGFL